jgi:hypothetical protein
MDVCSLVQYVLVLVGVCTCLSVNVCVYMHPPECVYVCTHAMYASHCTPAAYLWRGGLLGCLFASQWHRDLLEDQRHPTGVLLQFLHEVLPAPANLTMQSTMGVGVHIKLCLARPDLALSNTQAHKILTTIWSLTWITSSPASIFSQNSAGDCNAQANN